MILAICRENVPAQSMLGEKNWSALGKGVGGPPLCGNPFALSCCVVLQCLSGTNSLEHHDLISFDKRSLKFFLFFFFFGLIIISSFCICFIRDNLSLPALMK